MTRTFTKQTEDLDSAVHNVDLKLGETDATVKEIQTQVTALQANLTTLTQSVNALRVAIEQPQPEEFDDADSIHADNEDVLGNARGRGIGHARGRGFVPIGARRVHDQPQQEDVLGKPRFSIPNFDGQGDVEDYLAWELKIEKLWRLHDYTEIEK